MKDNTHNLFSLTVWLKIFQWNNTSLVFTLYFACFSSKGTLSVKSPKHAQTLMYVSLRMFHPAACSRLEGLKHLLVSEVVCLELMSCCLKQMTFSLIGVITIATSRHGGCLANPKINKWILCKWSLGIATWPLVSVVGDLEAVPATKGLFFVFPQHYLYFS